MKLKRLAILPALMLIVAFSASTGSSLFAPRVVDGGAFGSGLEIVRPVEEFAKTADVVVRGVPISRKTERRLLPPRPDMPEEHPLNFPRYRLIDTIRFEVAEYLKGAGPEVISLFDGRPIEEVLAGTDGSQLETGREYILFLDSTAGSSFWGDGYLIKGPTQGIWRVSGNEVERPLMPAQHKARMTIESLKEKVRRP